MYKPGRRASRPGGTHCAVACTKVWSRSSTSCSFFAARNRVIVSSFMASVARTGLDTCAQPHTHATYGHDGE